MVAADEVSIKISGQNTSTPAVDAAKRGMKGLKDEAGETTVKVKVLGESVKGTTRATDDLGDKARKTTRELSALDRKILELRASTLALGRQFEATGDNSLLKKFRSDSRELAGLERTRKQIAGLSGDVKTLGREAASTASTFSSLFQGGIIDFLKTPTGATAAGVLGGGLAINAGALAGGAVSAGAGLGVAGAGIAGAAMQSKDVQDEWTRVTDRIKSQFLAATTSFERPTIAAVRRLDAAVADIHMDKIFGDAAKFVEPLSAAAAKAVGSFGRGLEALVSKGEPAIRATAGLIEDVADGAEHAMEIIAGGGEGGAKAIRDLGNALNETVTDVGYFIRGMEEAYDKVDSFRQLAEYHPFIGLMYDIKGTDNVKVLSGTLDYAADKAEAAERAARGLSGALTDMSSEARLANDAFGRLFGTMMDLDTANLDVKLGLAGLRDAMNDDNTTRDELAEKVLRQIQLLQNQREAELATGDGSKAATDRINANYNSQLEQLKKMFPWLADLIQKYEDLAKPLTKHITVVIDQVGNVSKEGVISGGDQRTRVGAAYASGGITGAASGMVLSGLANVAERGRELALLAPGQAMLPPGSQVIPNGTTENMLSRGAPGDMREIVLRVEGGAGDALYEVMNVGLRTGKLQAFAKA